MAQVTKSLCEEIIRAEGDVGLTNWERFQLAHLALKSLPLAPLAPEVQEAVELANLWKDFPERDVGKLARALLKVVGHDR